MPGSRNPETQVDAAFSQIFRRHLSQHRGLFSAEPRRRIALRPDRELNHCAGENLAVDKTFEPCVQIRPVLSAKPVDVDICKLPDEGKKREIRNRQKIWQGGSGEQPGGDQGNGGDGAVTAIG